MKIITNTIAEEVRAWLESAEVKGAIEATTKAADTDTGTFEMVITTENLDRYEEVISLDGWELEHYMRNPVVLWGHDHNIIIAVTTSMEKRDGKIIAKGKFAPTEQGQEKRRLYDLGFLFASSVGFIVKERQGNLITRAELIEWSFVSVPANPYALTLAIEKELNINDLVTRGIFTLKDAEEAPVEPVAEPVTEPDDSREEVEEEPVAEPVTEPAAGKQFDAKTIAPIKEQLRSVLSALEALETPEPERTEEEPVAETEEEKALREFNDNRKTLQRASTIISEVLAEARRAIEAPKN